MDDPDAAMLDRRAFTVGATVAVAGAGALLAGCGFFTDSGPDRIRYGAAPSQFGELYEPDAPEPWPVVIAIHGGSWIDAEDLSIMENACSDLQRRGFAVWNIEYRRVGEPGGGYPGTLEDVAAAIDRLAPIARDRPLAKDPVAVMGHSAGGTLALWAGARSGLPAGAPGAGPTIVPEAAVCLAGVPDLATCARERQVDGACPRFLGGMPDERPGRYAVTSPIERLPLGLPQIVVHGRNDIVVPVSQSEAYAAAAQSAGDPVTLQLIAGAGHFSLIEPDHPAWTTVAGSIEGLRA